MATQHSPLHMIAPPDVYRNRRARLAGSLSRPIVVLAGFARSRKYATNTHAFRAASTYLYFGGPPVEGACWLIEPGSDGDAGCTLFRPAVGADDAVWVGEPRPDDALASAAGVRVSAVADSDALSGQLAKRSAAAICPPCPSSLSLVASLGLDEPRPEELMPIVDMRLYKDQHELVAMRRAARISVDAHLAAMKATAPGQREADVAAAFESVLVANEAEPSFTANVTIHGEVLHGSDHHNALAAGDLLLVDAGAEEPGGYTSDITRTYPVDGTFRPVQRLLYDTVLNAQRAAIAACTAGARFRDVHDLAARVVCEGLVEADILRGSAEELVARRAHTLFFTHGLGHLIGLDVHDMEEFGDLAGYPEGRVRRSEFGNKFLRLDRDLSPGMTVTIEPGVYFVPAVWRMNDLVKPLADCVNRKTVDKLLAGGFGGIRIEDTILVRAEGTPENLTAALPIDGDDVSAVVKGNS